MGQDAQQDLSGENLKALMLEKPSSPKPEEKLVRFSIEKPAPSSPKQNAEPKLVALDEGPTKSSNVSIFEQIEPAAPNAQIRLTAD
jgi:hypothetical protein